MALGKCKECNQEVSTSAKVCPKCGVDKPVPSDPKQIAIGCLGVIALLAVTVFLLDQCTANDLTKNTQEKKCANDDLHCLGEKGVVAASVYCKGEIEKLAKYDVKWTDGVLEPKFSRFGWRDKKLGVITYVGDKANFQNGFGAYAPVTYECDMLDKSVLGVRIKEGRLP